MGLELTARDMIPTVIPAFMDVIKYDDWKDNSETDGGFNPFFKCPICSHERNCSYQAKHIRPWSRNVTRRDGWTLLTTSTPCFSAWVKYTRMLPKITDVRGAMAFIQKKAAFLLLCSAKI